MRGEAMKKKNKKIRKKTQKKALRKKRGRKTKSRQNGQLKSIAGDAYMALVQWDKNGKIKSESIHQFGSSILNENSNHYSDQAHLFSKQALKPSYLDINDILKNVESIKIIY